MGSLIQNERGSLTLQFLFVFILILFFILSFFGLSLTLTNGSAVQYLTYSSARKLALADKNLGTQRQNALAQYRELRQKMFKGNYTSGNEWFQISASPRIGFNEEYQDASYRKMFYGVFTQFGSTRTNFKIPFLTDEQDGELKTTIAAYLGRDPSKEECETFNAERLSRICGLGYQNVQGITCNGSPREGDNGC